VDDANARIDAAIDRLDSALAALGLELRSAVDPDAIGRVERHLAPCSLPADLSRFWERVEAGRFKPGAR
jgi:hypothetical protein